MKTVVLILIAILFGAFAVIAFIENMKTKHEMNELKKQEKKNAKIDKETFEQINEVAGGDVHAGNNVLHNLANKSR